MLLLAAVECSAFVSRPSFARHGQSLLRAVELKPEPEGGEEIELVDATMASSRMKNMGEVPNVKDDRGKVYKFWLTAEAQGPLIKELHTQVLKDASKKANFPGFRKVSQQSGYGISLYSIQAILYSIFSIKGPGTSLRNDSNPGFRRPRGHH